jgi:SAM-dependent methyltransferase
VDLKQLQKNWDAFGRIDPLWAILTSPDRKGGKWDPEEFFASGRREIDHIMSRAQALALPALRETALDFGCGVGRLTQALCSWFERCCGVDIAPSMIALARQHNTCGVKCEYVLNTYNNLRIFPDHSFDFVYSSIVLQHMEPRYSTAYIREFIRVLRPRGLVVFQLPGSPRTTSPPNSGKGAPGPMPDSGFRARITGHPISIRAVAGTQVSVPATIQNLGQCAWPSLGDREQNYVVKLGNHWLTPEGKTVVWDDGRQSLPFDLQPNAEIQTGLMVTAPASPGKYILELDMVQEAVGWFKHKSSIPAVVHAEIEPSPILKAAVVADSAPQMEMYGVEKDNIIEVLQSGGAKVLDILEDGSPGPEWISYQYFATKS